MMADMMSFSIGLLDAIATFLGSEPIIYIFGLVCLVIVVKAFKDILTF